jgi:hypothetical protein
LAGLFLLGGIMRVAGNSVSGLNFKYWPVIGFVRPFSGYWREILFFFISHPVGLEFFLPGFMTNENFYHFDQIIFFLNTWDKKHKSLSYRTIYTEEKKYENKRKNLETTDDAVLNTRVPDGRSKRFVRFPTAMRVLLC